MGRRERVVVLAGLEPRAESKTAGSPSAEGKAQDHDGPGPRIAAATGPTAISAATTAAGPVGPTLETRAIGPALVACLG